MMEYASEHRIGRGFGGPLNQQLGQRHFDWRGLFRLAWCQACLLGLEPCVVKDKSP
jgi:hypothetical protein